MYPSLIIVIFSSKHTYIYTHKHTDIYTDNRNNNISASIFAHPTVMFKYKCTIIILH